MENIISLKKINKSFAYGDTTIDVLKDINVDIGCSEYISIMGPSGSGKSTLMNIIGCLDKPTSGSYTFMGKRVDQMNDLQISEIRGARIGFVFQSFNLLNNMSVLENVMLPMTYQNIEKSTQKKIAMKWLDRVKMSHRLIQTPDKISGGEKQRVAIARAFVNNPDIILADEPTGNLDSKTEEKIIDIFNELHREIKQTFIIVTHSDEVASITKRKIRLFDGKVV
ncbi:MAG: ABC transporter ATP-binding protein [Pseudomonadota bacterium]